VLLQRLQASLRLLAAPSVGDETIHALRRNLKQCRAYLLLLRPVLGKPAWRREEAALETAARSLGILRDRRVLQDTVDSLTAADRVDPLFEAFAHAVRREAQSVETELPGRITRQCRIQLTRSRGRLRALRLVRHNWSALGPSLRRSYRLARRARADSLKSGGDEALHRWRRWSKYLWHQMELIEVAGPDIREGGARLRHLADLLGRYHDLVVLRERAKRSASLAQDPAGGTHFLALLDTALATLRREAHERGAPLFAERPRDFAKRLRGDWRRWRQPQASSDSRR